MMPFSITQFSDFSVSFLLIHKLLHFIYHAIEVRNYENETGERPAMSVDTYRLRLITQKYSIPVSSSILRFFKLQLIY